MRSRTVLFGGDCANNEPAGDTFEFDGVAWHRAGGSARPRARWYMAAAFDSIRGSTVLFGGLDGASRDLDETWEFDGNVWSPGAAPSPPARPGARRSHAMAFDSRRDRIVMFGGQVSNKALDETWEYHRGVWAQMMTANRPSARQGHHLVYDERRQKAVLFGGQRQIGTLWIPANDTWEYDGVDWTEVVTATPPPVRYFGQMAYDTVRNRTVLFGGLSNGRQVNDTWEYDGRDWRPVSLVARPAARYLGGLVFDRARGRCVLMGGLSFESYRGNTFYSDTWEYDGAAWTRSSASDRPEVRFPTLTYDPVRDRILLNGGESGLAWEFASERWRQVGSSSGSRLRAKMAHDSVRGRTVVFGGGGLLGNVADTREFDGTTWHVVAPSVSPPPRAAHGMVYVPSRRRVLMFGGVHFSQPLGDTWEFDGVTWRRIITNNSPPARFDFGMSHDTGRDRTVLFGGFDGLAPANDTWEFDGVDWRRITTANAPSPRTYAAMSYDMVRGRTVLVGGLDRTNYGVGDTWEYDGSDWSRIATQGHPNLGPLWQAACYDQAGARILMFDGFDTWEFTPPALASFALHGTGCAGSAGVPTMVADPRVPPALGARFGLRIAPVPPQPGVALLMFGTDLVQWNGVRLPIRFGSPPCDLWIAPQTGTMLAIPHPGNAVDLTIQIPSSPTLAGVIATQALVIDPAAPNGIGALSSAAILNVR